MVGLTKKAATAAAFEKGSGQQQLRLRLSKMPNARKVAQKCVGIVVLVMVVVGSLLLLLFPGDLPLSLSLGLFLSPFYLPGIVALFFKYCTKNDYVPCYLCNNWVGKESWESGSHRGKCADKFGDVLRAMPCLYNNLRCYKCQEMLKLWPKERGGGRFICQAEGCPQKSKIYNEGFNMFSCFQCAHTVCLTCAHAQMHHQPHPSGEITTGAAAALVPHIIPASAVEGAVSLPPPPELAPFMRCSEDEKRGGPPPPPSTALEAPPSPPPTYEQSFMDRAPRNDFPPQV